MAIIDLHTHSTYSDGTFTPEELIREAEKRDVKAVALTDHDTIEGLPDFSKVQSDFVEKVPGIEISVQKKGEKYNFHMVGLFIDFENDEFLNKINILKNARIERNHKIVKKLNELGFQVTYEELEEIAGEVIGRPHISEILIKKGYFKDKSEVFNKLLKRGAPAYFEKFRYTPEEAIKMIKKAKGVSILAHPGLLPLKRKEKINLMKSLKDAGLDGIEVFYSEHTNDETSFLKDVAKKLNFVISGGSDFHGANKLGIDLGTGRGNLKVDYQVYRNLKKYKEGLNDIS